MLRELLYDECGFIVSAELVLVATILVLGLIVGMSQVQHAVNEELNDVAHAIGHLNQSYFFAGFRSFKSNGTAIKASYFGSFFKDQPDDCDCATDTCDITCQPARPECAPIP